MKKIDFALNSLRFSLKEVSLLILLVTIIGWSWYVKDTILAFEPKNKKLNRILQQKQKENESYSYVEDILSEHYDNLQKFKSIKAPDLFWLQEEIEWLIPRWIQIEETKMNAEEFTLRWLSPNLRTIDFLVSILNTYNNYYWWFQEEVRILNTTKKDTLYGFTIKWLIDQDKIINKIYSNDIDWDWVTDSYIEEVINSSGVKQKRSIINDKCPFTPSFNLVIWKLLDSSPTLVDIYPYYKENYNKGYFTFNSETWCLKSWDTEIKKNEE